MTEAVPPAPGRRAGEPPPGPGTPEEPGSPSDTALAFRPMPAAVDRLEPDGTTSRVDVGSLAVGDTVTLDDAPRDLAAETGTPPIPAAPVWLSRAASPFGIPVLDMRPVTWTTVSATGDPALAERFMGSRAATNLDYEGQRPQHAVNVACDVAYPPLPPAPDGRLFVASVMEEKWDVFLGGGHIQVLRSWTGAVTFVARVTVSADGTGTVHVDHLQFSADTATVDEDALREFDFVMKAYVFGLVVPYAAPQRLAGLDPQDIALAAFAAHGWRAAYATFLRMPLGLTTAAAVGHRSSRDGSRQETAVWWDPRARDVISSQGGSGHDPYWSDALAWVLAVLDGNPGTDWALGDLQPVAHDPVHTIDVRLRREVHRAITADELGAWEVEAAGEGWAAALSWALSVLRGGSAGAIHDSAHRTAFQQLGPAPDWAPGRH